jgi:prevent-host-death family protein
MPIVNMLEAKSTLSRLVEAVESGVETEIIIARNGKPAARLVPIAKPGRAIRFGLAKGLTETPDPDPELEEQAAALFRKSK